MNLWAVKVSWEQGDEWVSNDQLWVCPQGWELKGWLWDRESPGYMKAHMHVCACMCVILCTCNWGRAAALGLLYPDVSNRRDWGVAVGWIECLSPAYSHWRTSILLSQRWDRMKLLDESVEACLCLHECSEYLFMIRVASHVYIYLCIYVFTYLYIYTCSVNMCFVCVFLLQMWCWLDMGTWGCSRLASLELLSSAWYIYL